MIVFRWIVTTLFAVLAFWVTTLNWIAFKRRHLQKMEGNSWIPLIGGVLGAVAIALAPVDTLRPWWWIPLLVDWGTIPGLAYTVFSLLRRNRSASG